MLRYKVSPPRLPRCVDRPRLLERVSSSSVVTLAAPAGHGKTCLAMQLAEATRGPVAWFLADELDRDRSTVVGQLFGSLGLAWPDVVSLAPPTIEDDSAVPLLGAALEQLAGPGCLVMDDVHLLAGDVLDAVVRAAVAALPPTLRFVVCTRGAVPESLVKAEAAGHAVVLGATELTFDEDECRRVCGSVADEVFAQTGGWPLAVALASRRAPAVAAPRLGHLAEVALADLPDKARPLLVVLARLPRFPARLLRRLDDGAIELEAFGRRNPGLIPFEDGWWAPREWLREVLKLAAADAPTTAAVAGALRALDEDDLAAQLLLAEARYEDAAPVLEQLAAEGMRRGRAAHVHALLGSVPSSARTFTLDLLAATAAQALSLADPGGDPAGSELTLRDLVDRSAAEGASAQLQARALLASHYRMEADARLLGVCEEALGDALHVEAPQRELPGRWPLEEAPAAADLLRLYGYALLFASDRAIVERGRRLIGAALELLDAAGRSTTSQRGWLTYFEVLLFLRPAGDGVRPVRVVAHRMAELDHFEGPLRLAELATVEYLAGDPAARRTIEMARECAARTGNVIALTPLASIEVALDVLESGYQPEHGRRFDDIAAQLEAHPRLSPFTALIAAEFGLVLVRHGQLELARRYLELAERAIGETIFAHTNSFRCRRLRGLVLMAEGRSTDGRAVLEALQRDAAAEGRQGLVELTTCDLAAPTRHLAAVQPIPQRAPPPVVVHVLAPELRVTVDEEPLPAPRGYPAKLLALLVASCGSMTVDAAIEGLWPDADPELGRNRLHGVLLRLRRSLGLPAGGPISCTEGIVRLEPSPDVQVDAWIYGDILTRAATNPDLRPAALAAYAGDVLSVQFAYDDTVTEYRLELRRSFLRLATSVLADPPGRIDVDELAVLARRVSRAAPDDDNACLASVGALVRVGHRTEARELIDVTARALLDLGVCDEEFRRRAAAMLDPAVEQSA